MPSAPSSLPEQPSFSYAAGDTIAGKYALEELLGMGGMGAVFRARNCLIDMPVAIKLIRTDLDRELFSGRLLQEARAAAKLAHPSIVRVFDVGRTALGDPFIVMELLHGESLGALLEREGRLSGTRAVQLLLPIADALSVAHAKGFVHRDVKPDNIFLVKDESGQLQPKLVDFGIVKQDQVDEQALGVLGSPDYMSPEQARGLNVDLRSDIWAFCVVLYEIITGSMPFQAKSYSSLLRLIVDAEPVTLREQSASDEELSAIVARGLRKDPSQRFISMGQLGKALATWLYDQGLREDVCGVSLESKWLTRSSDPMAAPHVSRSSHPDGWPEPPSGVRAIGLRPGSMPTLQLGQGAATPHSLASTSARVPANRRAYLAAAAALVLVAVIALVSAKSFQQAPEPRPAASHSTVSAIGAEPQPAESAAPVVATTLAETPAAPVPSASSRPARVKTLKVRAPAPAAPPQQPGAQQPGASDLLSPY